MLSDCVKRWTGHALSLQFRQIFVYALCSPPAVTHSQNHRGTASYNVASGKHSGYIRLHPFTVDLYGSVFTDAQVGHTLGYKRVRRYSDGNNHKICFNNKL